MNFVSSVFPNISLLFFIYILFFKHHILSTLMKILDPYCSLLLLQVLPAFSNTIAGAGRLATILQVLDAWLLLQVLHAWLLFKVLQAWHVWLATGGIRVRKSSNCVVSKRRNTGSEGRQDCVVSKRRNAGPEGRQDCVVSKRRNTGSEGIQTQSANSYNLHHSHLQIFPQRESS